MARYKTAAVRIAEMKKLLESGPLDSTQIASRLQMSKENVWVIAKKAGLEDKIIKRRGTDISAGDCL
jgi:DNA-binding Lrp family transcriptional regulator